MSTKQIFLAASCLALNLSLGKVAALLSLPVYLDSIGTILAAALLPAALAIGVGVLTSAIASIVINPYFLAYAGTQATIAIVAILGARAGLFGTWWKALLVGVMIAIAAAAVSAPVTVLLFGGITLTGTTAINAVLLASGRTLWQSVVGGALLVEGIDKPTAALLAWLTLRRLPAALRRSSTAAAA